MNESENIDLQFIRYREGILTQKEKEELEGLIQSNPEYRKRLELHLSMEIAFENPSELEKYLELESFWKQYITSARSFRNFYGIAATIILLLGSGILIWYMFFIPDRGQRLYSEYFSPIDPPEEYRVKNQEINSLYVNAFQFYSKKQYPRAQEKILVLLKRDSLNSALLLYSGICYMESEQWELSLSCFSKILSLNDPVYKESALWYAGLAFIKLNRYTESKYYFKQLIAIKGFYQTQANEILDKISD
ncbi:MAG: hypothetical protein NTU44_15730 [Bacteroidetes bacterium]|nr:hypothetical protein [Bacteroidota bacterium]